MGLTIALFWLLALLIGVLVLVQGLTRKVDLFSIRNIYLAGFIVYQINSPVSVLETDGKYTSYPIDNLRGAGNSMLMFAYVYVIVFLLSYHYLRISRWIASKIKITSATASDSMLTGLAIGLVLTATVFQIISLQVPALRSPAINVAVALAATGCAITGWVWGARRMNPAVIGVVAFVFTISIGVSLLGIFSRRPLISILAGFAWGAYFRWARSLSFGKLLLSITPILLVGAVIVSAYTAIRDPKSFLSTQETLRRMSQADLNAGSESLFGGQTCGAASLWILDTYPREIDYKHLNSFKTLAFFWIPSLLWEDKPTPLGNHIARLARLEGCDWDAITLPPGVVGYAGAEGGFYALVLYAIFFGQFTRLFDEMVRLHPTNPFVLLPIGCATGQFLGLARGEIAVFANLAVLNVVVAFVILYVAASALGGARKAPKGMFAPQLR